MLKPLLILFLLLPFFGQGQDNTATPIDTSRWKSIRDDIALQTSLIELFPADAEYYFNRGDLKTKILDFKGALEDINKSLSLMPDNAAIYYKRGGIKEYLGDFVGCIADFSKVIESQPDFEWAWNDRGQIYIELKEYKETRADFEKARQLKPKWANPVFNIGLLFSEKGNADSAIFYYKKA